MYWELVSYSLVLFLLFFRQYLCLILCNVNMFVFFVLLHLLLSYIILCFVKMIQISFYLHFAPNLYLKMGKCNKWTMYSWSGVGKSVAYRRDKPLNADKSTVLHLQICATQASTSCLPESFMNSERTSSVANGVIHWRICTFLDMSAALLYIVHCNQANSLILVEILLYLRVCSTWSIVLTSMPRKNLYYVYKTQTSAEYPR